jgi:CopG family transcriptional regulator/antitoxin EndoAI
MATTTRTSKTITISLPPEMAARAEALARSDNRTMSELFREAFRLYYSRHVNESFANIRRYAATRNPMGYTEEDVPRLIKEVRAEEEARRLDKDL